MQENKSASHSKQNSITTIEEKLNFVFERIVANESTITNEHLLYLLQKKDKKKICLLDTRPSDVFHKHQIISCDVINIPKENLVPG